MAWVKWVNLILGILVIVAPFAVGTAANLSALLANVVLGALIVVFAFVLEMVGRKGEGAKAARS